MSSTVANGQKEIKQGTRKIDLQKLVILGILVLVVLVFTAMNRRFVSIANILFILRQSSFVIMTGCAVTLLMISGNLDLSVGSTVALSGVTHAFLCQSGVATPLAFFISVAVGTLIGVINAVTVVKLRITPFIATLGTMYVGRGLSYLITDGLVIRDGLPDNFTIAGREYVGPLPIPVLVLIAVVVIFIIIEKRSLLGKYSIAIGGNRTAATLSGINSDSVIMILYIIVGALAGFSGVMMASRLGVGDPNIGIGFEFDVIIAVILGGTSLAGGEGSVLGMIIGGLILGSLENGLKLLNVFTFFQSVVKGIVLVLAVILDQKLKSTIRLSGRRDK
jgi:ribose/xylose/arabinose/galactoside ABC-type transport system permease subunit